MDLSQLDLPALSRALDDSDPDREHFLEPATGCLWTFVFSQATDETRERWEQVQGAPEGQWVRVPSPTPREAYEEAEDFVNGIAEEEAREGLFAALERRGSLKDFREELMRFPEIRAHWLAVRRRRSKERLDAYLGGFGLPVPAGDGADPR
jgi:hypothetical protein